MLEIPAWLEQACVKELHWNFIISGEKMGEEGKEMGIYLSRESWIIQWKKCIVHHVTLEGTNLDIRPFKNTEQQNS